jgi:predicted Zn finger-like uncharacterized protein
MICPACKSRITFVDAIKSWHPTRVRCGQCGTLFRITAPRQTVLLCCVLGGFLLAAAGLGDVFVTKPWAGVIGILGLALLLVFVEFLTYRYYSTHGKLHKVEAENS